MREAAEKLHAESRAGYDPTQYQNPHPLDAAANATSTSSTGTGTGQGQGLLEQSGPAEENEEVAAAAAAAEEKTVSTSIYPRWCDLPEDMQELLLEKTVDAFLNMGLPIAQQVLA